SMGEIMSRTVERSDNAAAHPLVKVYTKERLRQLFEGFVDIEIVQRQMVADEVPRLLVWMPRHALGKFMGWNLILKARKPASKSTRPIHWCSPALPASCVVPLRRCRWSTQHGAGGGSNVPVYMSALGRGRSKYSARLIRSALETPSQPLRGFSVT